MENSNLKLAGALLVGAAIGGTLGILLAPKKGSKTRKVISGKTDDLTDLIKEKLHHFLSDIKKEAIVVKDKASHLITEVKPK
jgi:gas vesicle protein